MFTSSGSSSQKVYTKTYSNFKGVDLSNAITEVDPSRSPDALNMIPSAGGFPMKRPGWGVVENEFGARINGIYKFVDHHGVMRMVVHAGQNIWCFVETEPIVQPTPPTSWVYIAVLPDESVPTLLYMGVGDYRSQGFVIGGALYILDGKDYVKVYYNDNASAVMCVQVTGYIPTTVIGASPTGGGTDYEPINLISASRINMFAGTAGATQYQLDAAPIDQVTIIKKLNSSGVWQTVPASGYSVNETTGTVTFTTAPGISPITGEDNVKIEFEKTVTANENKIRKCRICTFFGSGGDTRIFVSGNTTYRNYDWCSGFNDPTYFPETSYSVIGADSASIMGYLKQYGDLVIVKQQNDQDATLFLRSVSTDSDGNLIFPVTQGLNGIGAVSQHCFATLNDDNLFLSNTGVFGLDTSKVTLQKTTQNRSYYINKVLSALPDKAEMVACVWKDYYCLFCGNLMFLADAKQRNNNVSNSFGYEWYVWDNVPARVAMEYEGELYFGTNMGVVSKFKDPDTLGMDAYNDNGEIISSYWTTKLDDLDDPSTYKTIKKRNIGVVAMPFGRSSAVIKYLKDGEEKSIADAFYNMSSSFDFDDVNFDIISFGMSETPYFIPCNKKSKKNRMFRLKIQNSQINEGFGLYKIVFNYEYSKVIKH